MPYHFSLQKKTAYQHVLTYIVSGFAVSAAKVLVSGVSDPCCCISCLTKTMDTFDNKDMEVWVRVDPKSFHGVIGTTCNVYPATFVVLLYSLEWFPLIPQIFSL